MKLLDQLLARWPGWRFAQRPHNPALDRDLQRLWTGDRACPACAGGGAVKCLLGWDRCEACNGSGIDLGIAMCDCEACQGRVPARPGALSSGQIIDEAYTRLSGALTVDELGDAYRSANDAIERPLRAGCPQPVETDAPLETLDDLYIQAPYQPYVWHSIEELIAQRDDWRRSALWRERWISDSLHGAPR